VTGQVRLAVKAQTRGYIAQLPTSEQQPPHFLTLLDHPQTPQTGAKSTCQTLLAPTQSADTAARPKTSNAAPGVKPNVTARGSVKGLHWKTHKKTCQSSPTARSQSRNAVPKGLTAAISKPFQKLDARTWLHDRPEKDVYKLLIDTFRLKLDDDYKFEGDVCEGTVYGGAPSSVPGFRKFLLQAKSQSGLLPPWWSDENASECIAFGMSDSWTSLSERPRRVT